MSHTVKFGSHKIEFTANPMYEITGRKPQTTFVYHLDEQGFATIYERYDIKEITVNQ